MVSLGWSLNMRTMSVRGCIGMLAFLTVLLLGSAAIAAPPVPPAPTAHVTDMVGMLSPATRSSLENRLTAYERATGKQVVVWLDNSLEGASLEEFAVRAFESWGIGRRGQDDGVALFVFAEDRKLRIEVGYGLEDRITDLAASKIIRDIAAPQLRAGDPDAAITGAVEALVDTIEGHANALPRGPPDTVAPEPQHSSGGPSLGEMIVYAILGIGFLVLLVTNPMLALQLLFVMGRGGGRGLGGGGFGGGGGFSGGGGRSGGGGASGGW